MRTTICQLYPDIWQQIFEYFHAIELFFSLMHITKEADEVLFNINHHLYLRGLVLDANVRTLPEKILFRQVISLELHQNNLFSSFQQCLELRSLKLIGHPKWIISRLREISQVNLKLEQLTLIVPGISLLHNLLESISKLLSLRRLEIYGDELEEKINSSTSFLAETNIEQFILHSSTSLSWSDLSYMLPVLSNIYFLDIALFRLNKISVCSFIFPKLRSVSLILLEIPFECIIQLVTTMPSLVKLKLNGLVDADGYVIDNKWLSLFEFCSSLNRIIVNVSLEQDSIYYYDELVQEVLRRINLDLSLIDNDFENYLNVQNQHRWWNLSGRVVKQNRHVKGKYETFS